MSLDVSISTTVENKHRYTINVNLLLSLKFTELTIYYYYNMYSNNTTIVNYCMVNQNVNISY